LSGLAQLVRRFPNYAANEKAASRFDLLVVSEDIRWPRIAATGSAALGCSVLTCTLEPLAPVTSRMDHDHLRADKLRRAKTLRNSYEFSNKTGAK